MESSLNSRGYLLNLEDIYIYIYITNRNIADRILAAETTVNGSLIIKSDASRYRRCLTCLTR